MTQLGEQLRLSQRLLEPRKLEIAAEVNILGDEAHLDERFLHFFDPIGQENAPLQVLLKLDQHARLRIGRLELCLLTVIARSQHERRILFLLSFSHFSLESAISGPLFAQSALLVALLGLFVLQLGPLAEKRPNLEHLGEELRLEHGGVLGLERRAA